jgi:hypothetical protein
VPVTLLRTDRKSIYIEVFLELHYMVKNHRTAKIRKEQETIRKHKSRQSYASVATYTSGVNASTLIHP